MPLTKAIFVDIRTVSNGELQFFGEQRGILLIVWYYRPLSSAISQSRIEQDS